MVKNFGKSEIHLDGFNLRKSIKISELNRNVNEKVYLYVCV